MNNAKMWLVVKPTVGVPLFLSAVAIGSFAVHVAVLSNTSWVSDFLQGQPMGTGDEMARVIDDADMNRVTPASHRAFVDGDRVVIVLPNGERTYAKIESPETLAYVSAPQRQSN